MITVYKLLFSKISVLLQHNFKFVNDSQKDIFYQLIGSKILQYLTVVREIKQVELAKKLNISKSTLSNILSGKRTTTLHLLVEISMVLDEEPSYFIPTLEEIKNAFSAQQKNIENILGSQPISDVDRETILNLITAPKNPKNDNPSN